MVLDPDGAIRSVIEEVIVLAKAKDQRAGVGRLAALERDLMSSLDVLTSEESSERLIDPAVSLRLYVALARKDFRAGDSDGALISLERAFAIVTKHGARPASGSE